MLSCLFVFMLGIMVLDFVWSESSDGWLATDIFLALLVGTPFFLLIRWLWAKAEDINVAQHNESVHRSS